MTDRLHCPEHEQRTQCMAENTACIKAMKRERELQFKQMTETQEDIYDKLDGLEKEKVDMGMFKWIMSAVGAVSVMILVVLMAQAVTMAEMKADLRVLTIEVKGQPYER